MKKHTHVGVYGIIINDNKILLVKKQRGPYVGKWDLPGGGVEPGETSIETSNRELLEECGYSAAETKLANVINNRIVYLNNENQREELTLLSIIYFVTLKQYEHADKQNIVRDTEDVSDSKWFNLHEVLLTPLTPTAVYAIGLKNTSSQ